MIKNLINNRVFVGLFALILCSLGVLYFISVVLRYNIFPHEKPQYDLETDDPLFSQYTKYNFLTQITFAYKGKWNSIISYRLKGVTKLIFFYRLPGVGIKLFEVTDANRIAEFVARIKVREPVSMIDIEPTYAIWVKFEREGGAYEAMLWSHFKSSDFPSCAELSKMSKSEIGKMISEHLSEILNIAANNDSVYLIHRELISCVIVLNPDAICDVLLNGNKFEKIRLLNALIDANDDIAHPLVEYEGDLSPSNLKAKLDKVAVILKECRQNEEDEEIINGYKLIDIDKWR